MNREKIWKEMYEKYGEELSGETDFRGFAELIKEKGVKGYDKGEALYGSPDKDKKKEFNFTYPKNPEGKLDLHGETTLEAPGITEKFVNESREIGKTFVIIVFGMGRNSPEGKSKLRPVVIAKLLDLLNNKRIRNYKTADPKDGGYGAVYVYLK